MMELNRTIIERGDIKCIRWRISRDLLERIDKNYYGFGSRNAFLEDIIKNALDKLEADEKKNE